MRAMVWELANRRVNGAVPTEPRESTATLLRLTREGDDEARDRLFGLYLPVLQRWARGRLPRYARDRMDTDDLVQTVLFKALRRVNDFEHQREGSFLAYLRTILLNSIRHEIRTTGRRPQQSELDEKLPTDSASPVERAIGRQQAAAYEEALAVLPPRQREALILRIEMGFSHRQVAEAIGSPSENAARMMVTRAIAALAQSIDV